MTNMPETRDSLIAQVRDPANHEAWEQFSRIYRPIVFRLARGRGLQEADADDLSQRVLLAIAQAIPDWQQQAPPTRFRHWLQRIAKNAIINALTRGHRFSAAGGTDVLDLLAGVPAENDDIERRIELEYQRQIYRKAAEVVRDSVQESTWQAFVQTVVEGASTESVATRMGKTIGNVHAARSRIMRRLQTVVKQLQEEDE